MRRKDLLLDGFRLSFLDNEAAGTPLVCLHGHFGCGSMFSFLERHHHGRLLLIDLRGHGESDRRSTYRTVDYTQDVEALLASERVEGPVILGHSLGGIVAIYYAARNPACRGIVIEDIGTRVDLSNRFIMSIPQEADDLYEMEQAFDAMGERLDHYFMESLRYDGVKWRFTFSHEDMIASQDEMNGDHWQAWMSVGCPVLLLHGDKSWACRTDNIRSMAAAKANCQLKVYHGAGHTLRDFDRARYVSDVLRFVDELPPTPLVAGAPATHVGRS